MNNILNATYFAQNYYFKLNNSDVKTEDKDNVNTQQNSQAATAEENTANLSDLTKEFFWEANIGIISSEELCTRLKNMGISFTYSEAEVNAEINGNSYKYSKKNDNNNSNNNETKNLSEQIFSFDEILKVGFSPSDITKYFSLDKDKDGKLGYKINASVNVGDANYLERFYEDIIKQKIDKITLKFEAGAITFNEIISELAKIGVKNIKQEENSQGCPTITFEYGRQSSEIVNTVQQNVNIKWATFFISKQPLNMFVPILEKIAGVTDVEYRENEDGLRQITYKVDKVPHTFIQSSLATTENNEFEDFYDDTGCTVDQLKNLGFNESEIDKYFNPEHNDNEHPERSTKKLKHNIVINGEKIYTVKDLQAVVVYDRIRKESEAENK